MRSAATEGWARGKDRFGDVTYVKVAAGEARELKLDGMAAQP